VLGARALTRLRERAAAHPGLRVRGLGLMIGIEVADPDGAPRADLAEAIEGRARADGVLLIRSGPEANVIRVLPPLVITDEELELALDVLEASVDAVLRA
jgi:4-aminobutyrate aminotransferase-like enzyme